jgi:hypothetical protein
MVRIRDRVTPGPSLREPEGCVWTGKASCSGKHRRHHDDRGARHVHPGRHAGSQRSAVGRGAAWAALATQSGGGWAADPPIPVGKVGFGVDIVGITDGSMPSARCGCGTTTPAGRSSNRSRISATTEPQPDGPTEGPARHGCRLWEHWRCSSRVARGARVRFTAVPTGVAPLGPWPTWDDREPIGG